VQIALSVFTLCVILKIGASSDKLFLIYWSQIADTIGENGEHRLEYDYEFSVDENRDQSVIPDFQSKKIPIISECDFFRPNICFE
jgi:hypothetical protein